MNIDYTTIIAKANERKDALLRFERTVSDMCSEINENPNPLIDALSDFKQAFYALDIEARTMIGGDQVYPIVQFADAVLAMWKQLDVSDAYRKITPRAALYKLGTIEG